MPFTLPNLGDGAFPDQSQPDKVDFDVIASGSAVTGTTSGCAVTTTGTGNGSVTVAAGQIRVVNQLYTVAGNTVAITANSSGNPRFDLVTVGSSGTAVATAGTAAAAPVFPAVPAGSVALAAVRVPNGHTTGTTIPANTIVDKRMVVSAILAAPVDNSAYHSLVMPDDDRAGLRIYGGTGGGGTVNFQLTEWLDYLGAPIAWLNLAGGFYINDYIRTTYSVLGPDNSMWDIYGFQWQGTRCSFSFPGPPGNMMTWADACHENHQAARDATVANWANVSNTTLTTTDLGVPPNSPTRLRSALRMTCSASGNMWVAQPGSFLAMPGLTAGRPFSVVAYFRPNNIAATRTAQVRVNFYDNAGSAVGGDVNSSAVNLTVGAPWTKVAIDGTVVPATATRAQLHLLVNSAVSGEIVDVCGVGAMKNAQFGIFSPPFVAQDITTGGAKPDGEGVAVAGARWTRTDQPKVPGNREYMCSVGGIPRDQEWIAVDASSLYRLDADVSSTSTSQADVAPFAVAVDANGSYALDFDLFLTTAATTTGWTIGFTGPASPTYFFAVVEYQSSATAWTTATIQSLTNFTAVTAAYVAAPSIIRMRIRAQLVNGANAGTLNLRWATEVNSSAAIIKKGSMLNVT